MADIATRLELQAQACATMGSPFTAALIREAAADYRGGDRVRALLDAYPNFTRPGLHLAGALHYLALAGEPPLTRRFPSVGGDGDAQAAWRAARAMLVEHPERIERLFTRIPQTNEPARSLPLLGAFALIAARTNLPLRLREIGASAGLNLRFDRYGYAGAQWCWGDQRSPLVLHNRTRSGCPAHLDARIVVDERRGCDPHPLDVSSEEDRLVLQSFVWADQTERLERLRAALEVAQAIPVRIDAEGFETWVPREGTPRAGCATVLFHTVVEEHLSHRDHAALRDAVFDRARRASPEAPLAYVRMELEGGTYPLRVALWPRLGAPAVVCESDGHGQGILWSEPSL
jgi:hypothetical protein